MSQHVAAHTPEQEQTVFLEGAKHGHILYRQLHQGKQLTPRTIYDFLMTVLLDTTHPSVWNAGYITGWYLAKQQAEDSTETLVNAAAVQLKGHRLALSLTEREV